MYIYIYMYYIYKYIVYQIIYIYTHVILHSCADPANRHPAASFWMRWIRQSPEAKDVRGVTTELSWPDRAWRQHEGCNHIRWLFTINSCKLNIKYFHHHWIFWTIIRLSFTINSSKHKTLSFVISTWILRISQDMVIICENLVLL